MYYIVVLGLMLVLPALSIAAELFFMQGAGFWTLFGKWFVFWGIGAPLGLAGVRQMLNPAFTAKDIFEIDDPAAGKIVQELGFANSAIGLIALLSLAWPAWVAPAAVAGGLFYLLA